MEKLINRTVKHGYGTVYYLNLTDDIGDEVDIVEYNDGSFNDDGYVDFNLMGIDNRDEVMAAITKRWSVEFDGEVMFTSSNKPQDFYNLLQAMLQSYAYMEFYRRGWIK
ncbi:hypothetical protein [Lactobacillus sp. 3B(2020)]|uniref:hypothetical protein n=1 Tax=Lactobacillus sp. 3B(2020) TaxID=2695882 RepID=UPI0015DE76CC|nr:hypothetical protein [Lactobacillus sp. 3B(2020)]QLL69846.1 hypothetical protein GTO83_04485 [Lactobacillus sp. 3B(2020)]